MVTPRGGILVRVIEGKTVGGSQDWRGPGTGPNAGLEMWIPYSHVVSVNRKVRQPRVVAVSSQHRRKQGIGPGAGPSPRAAATTCIGVWGCRSAVQIMGKVRLIREALLW